MAYKDFFPEFPSKRGNFGRFGKTDNIIVNIQLSDKEYLYWNGTIEISDFVKSDLIKLLVTKGFTKGLGFIIFEKRDFEKRYFVLEFSVLLTVFFRFLERFGRRDRLSWWINYKTLFLGYQLFKKNPKEFKEALDTAKTEQEFSILAGLS